MSSVSDSELYQQSDRTTSVVLPEVSQKPTVSDWNFQLAVFCAEMVDKFSEIQLQEFRDAFDLFDEDGQGFITTEVCLWSGLSSVAIQRRAAFIRTGD